MHQAAPSNLRAEPSCNFIERNAARFSPAGGAIAAVPIENGTDEGPLDTVVLLAAASVATALTITQVDVIVGGHHFCDTSTACGSQIWNLNGGVNLTPGQNLILTQTGFLNPPIGGNFDTSDRGANDALGACTQTTPCRTQI